MRAKGFAVAKRLTGPRIVYFQTLDTGAGVEGPPAQVGMAQTVEGDTLALPWGMPPSKLLPRV